MAVDLHTDQIQGFFDGPVDHLLRAAAARPTTSPASTPTERPHRGLPRLRPGAHRRALGRTGSAAAPIAFIHKTRDPDRPNQVVANRVVGEVAGRTCIVVDDMIDTGGTIAKAVQQVLEAGATQGDRRGHPRRAVRTRRPSGCRAAGRIEVVLTNTLAIPAEHQFAQLTVLSIAPLIAQAIHEVFEDGSVTSLFDV